MVNSITVANRMSVGGNYLLTVTVTNTGSTTWNEGARTRLGFVGDDDLSFTSPNRLRLDPDEVVPPGKQKRWQLVITSPPSPGRYRLQVRMVRDGVAWFGQASSSIPIVVGSGVAPTVDFSVGRGGITAIQYRGNDLVAGTGGLYVVGSCTGADNDPRVGVTSVGASGPLLIGGESCGGRVPFSASIRKTAPNRARVLFRVGPMPSDFETLSVPLDGAKLIFKSFRFKRPGWRNGCANNWVTETGSGADFARIRTLCPIPAGNGFPGGFAGLADAPAQAWGYIAGSKGTIRVVYNWPGEHFSRMHFYRHPGTHNIEVGFGRVKRGESVMLEADVWVY